LKQPVTALPAQSADCSPKIAALFEVWQRNFPKSGIQSLVCRSPGYFVLTKRSVHLLSTASHQPLQAHLLLELAHDCVAAIEPMGRWFVTLENTRAGKLCFWRLRDTGTASLMARSTIALQSMPLLPPLLFAMDSHHAVVITTAVEQSRSPSRGGDRKGGTLVQVLTRRGSEAGLLQLPVRVGQAIQTSVPYQLLATDADNPESVLLLDLKPYRMLRLEVGLVPKFLSATSWGFVLADGMGNIAFLAQDGEMLGRVQGVAGMTAIAPCNGHHIQVATWEGQQGKLYTADIRELGIDLLF
jgi:hypothetical protein